MEQQRKQQDSSQIRQQRRQKKKTLRRICLFIGCLVMALGLCSGIFFIKVLSKPDNSTEVLTGSTIDIIIPEGASTATIANILEENQLIGNTFVFRLQSKQWGLDGTYMQGDYAVDTGLTTIQIMELLQTGVILDTIKLTIPEGYNTQQIAKKVEEAGIGTEEEFIEATQSGAFSYEFLEGIPTREFPLEGYLFPETYHFKVEDTVEDVIYLMLEQFNKVYINEIKPNIGNSEYSVDELVTMASIIEKEIVLDEERPRAAGVIYNRLKEGMPLQMDATVLYAMGIVKEDVTYTDLEFDSPYNTYQVKGLPIGPIANPGKISLIATLNAEDHEYLYYVLEAKGSQNHIYTETYDEFLGAKAKYKASGN